MKTKLAIAALGIALSAPVMAYNPEGNVSMCETVREGGHNAMESRQRGLTIDKALVGVSSLRNITLKAYSYPTFPDIDTKAKAIQDFGGQMFLSCMSGGMEFDDNDVIILL